MLGLDRATVQYSGLITIATLHFRRRRNFRCKKRLSSTRSTTMYQRRKMNKPTFSTTNNAHVEGSQGRKINEVKLIAGLISPRLIFAAVTLRHAHYSSWKKLACSFFVVGTQWSIWSTKDFFYHENFYIYGNAIRRLYCTVARPK